MNLRNFVNTKMLVLIAQDFSECTYSVCVCVFRVASGDKIQRNVQ